MATSQIAQSVSFRSNVALLQQGSPQSLSATTLLTGKVDRTQIARAQWRLLVGAVAAGATVNMKLQESDDDISYTDVAGAAITELDDADDDVSAVIEVDCDWAVLSKRYLKVLVTTAVGAALVAVDTWGIIRGLPQAETLDVDAVVQRLILPVPVLVPPQ